MLSVYSRYKGNAVEQITMLKCRHQTKIILEDGFAIYKCSLNTGANPECFLKIKAQLKNKNVPNGECPFAYRDILLSECPYFENNL